MIFDSLDNLARYETFIPALKAVRHILGAEALHEKAPGSYRTDVPGCRYNIAQYETCPGSKAFEIHRKEADVQIMLSGTERMEGAPRSLSDQAGPYDEGADAAMAEGTGCVSFTAVPGYFAVFLPGEPHAPGLAAGNAATVKKAVFKLTM